MRIEEESLSVQAATADPCARCDYDLRGVGDQDPCPECGLLAERSRHGSAHLTDAAPGWLRGISVGVFLIGLAHLLAAAWIGALMVFVSLPESQAHLRSVRAAMDPYQLVLLVFDLAAVLLLAGTVLLTRRQRRAGPMASQDRLLRGLLRIAAVMPIIGLAFLHAVTLMGKVFGDPDPLIAILILTVGCAPLPALAFLYLRRLAKRVLHPGLAEHAAIVGVGLSITFVSVPALGFFSKRFSSNSMWELVLPLIMLIAPILFGGWSLLNCVRFVIAFAKAQRGANRKWLAADRATLS